MRYCCSAYDKAMMDAYDIVMRRYDLERSNKYLTMEGSEGLKQQVCEHVGIPNRYITHFYLGYGGDMKILRYYISADDELGAVILVIRGTYSVTQWHIDFQGQSKEFCGGQAHSGIADLATAIAEKSRAEILSVLAQHPTYKLIITGQSLGGGVSPLVNMLFHKDPVISRREIECHAFAGPPVYCAQNAPPFVEKAIRNCVHYIHGDDVVPYLSLHQVRRLDAKLLEIEKYTSKMGNFGPELVAMGRKSPTKELIEAALTGDSGLMPIPGGPKLIMPAKKIVWFGYDEEMDKVTFTVCDPVAFSDLDIYLKPTALRHHVPQNYEVVLNKAEASGWKQMK